MLTIVNNAVWLVYVQYNFGVVGILVNYLTVKCNVVLF